MGAIFRINIIISKDIVKTLKEIKKHKFKVLATSLETNNNIYDIDYNKKVLVIGNEANGVSKEVLELADEKAKIPMLRKNRKLKCFCCNKCNFI
jgi:TrmH family RNA methyltransferase